MMEVEKVRVVKNSRDEKNDFLEDSHEVTVFKVGEKEVKVYSHSERISMYMLKMEDAGFQKRVVSFSEVLFLPCGYGVRLSFEENDYPHAFAHLWIEGKLTDEELFSLITWLEAEAYEEWKKQEVMWDE